MHIKGGLDQNRGLGRRRGALAVAFLLAVAGLFHAGGGARASDLVLPQGLADLVAEAEWVTVADLVGAQARRNARGNLIVTDYRFRVVQSVLGLPPQEFVLTQGGGTLAGETHAISDAPAFTVGERYLLFVRPGRGEMFPPFVGGAQGVYRFAPDGSATSLGGDRVRFERDALLDQVIALAGQRGAAPPRVPDAGTMPPGSYPQKRFLPLALTPPASAARAPAVATAADAPVSGATAFAAPGPVVSTIQSDGPGPKYYYEHRITPPAVINGFPHDWTPWYPEDEYQMTKWNQFGGDVLRVYTTPTGDWAFGNDRFDLAGWPDNATMIAQFGEGWGATTLGITWSRWFGDGPIVESDVALNPAYCWTMDELDALDDGNACWGFRQTMLHELGHVWGLKHPWETQDVWWDSVMNYSPKRYRIAQLFTDDANAVRAAFAGPAIHDALISLYTTADDGASMQPTYTATQGFQISVRHGDDLASWITNPFKVENLGTDEIISPVVEFYLSQQRLGWSAYSYLGNASYPTVPTFFTYTYSLPSLPVPWWTPTGDYYFAAYLPAADAILGNNSAWADTGMRVHVDNLPTMLVPELEWQTSETGWLGPAGKWSFEFQGEAGMTYWFSLCPGSGGSADFDTTISIDYLSTELAYDDDTCGLQSELAFTAPYDATFSVTIGSYGNLYQGTFAMGYRREISDTLFEDGFD
jgi:hypothetical protein